MNKYVSVLLFGPILLCFFLLAGCASIVSGTSQSVSVTTTPVTGAMCALSNSEGKWYIPYTPSSVVIHKSTSDLNIDCQKVGYYDGYARVKSHLRPMIAGNVIFGFAGTIGAGVDSVDGAAFSYPIDIQIPMVPKSN